MTTSPAELATARAALFVPGDRPDRFGKAARTGADLVVLDLEDSVAPEEKVRARSSAGAWFAGGGTGMVRVNAPGTPWFESDLMMAVRHGRAVMMPKAELPAAVAEVGTAVPAICVLVETAAGVEAAAALCAVPGVARAAFGNVDLAAQLGVRHDDPLPLRYARFRLVLACAAAGIAPPLDGVTTDLNDDGRLAADIAEARRLGFGGKMCVHPRQIPAVHAGFAPTAEEIAWAGKVLGVGDSVAAVDGQMVDRPVVRRARRIRDAGMSSR